MKNTAEVVNTGKGSLARAPDLDWSQVRETIRMLNLAVAQITASLVDGDESVDTLGQSFTAMADTIKSIQSMAEHMSDQVDAEQKRILIERCSSLSSRTQAAIVAFQFYDRITQRLSHVCNSLESLSDLVSDDSRLYHPSQWAALQQQIRSKFTMESDRLMFDALMEGSSIQEVLAMHKNSTTSTDDDDDIELF